MIKLIIKQEQSTEENAKQINLYIIIYMKIKYYVEKESGVVIKWIVNNKLGPFQHNDYDLCITSIGLRLHSVL